MDQLTRSELDRVSLDGLKLYTADNGNPVVFMNNAFWLECEVNDTAFTEPVKRTGNWEAWVATAIYNELNSAPCEFIDVGTNVGYYTLMAQSMGIYTTSFEPNETLVDMVMRSTDINGMRGLGIIVHCALGSTRETLKLYTHENHSGANSLCGPGDNYIEVEVWPLDALYVPDQIKQVLKVDVEGFEREVWDGAKTLRSHRETVWFLEWVPVRRGKEYNREWLHEVLETHDIQMVNYDGSLRYIGVEEALNVEFETIVFRSR